MQSKGNSEKWQALNFKINRVKSVRQHVRDEPPYLFFLIYYIYIYNNYSIYIIYTLYTFYASKRIAPNSPGFPMVNNDSVM